MTSNPMMRNFSDAIQEESGSFNDMFTKLNEITELNNKMDMTNKYKLIGKDLEHGVNNDYKINNQTYRHQNNPIDIQEDLVKLDTMLQHIIDKDNSNNHSKHDMTIPYAESVINVDNINK